MSSANVPSVVATPAALEHLVDLLGSTDTLAIDTEFHAERRYQPELMLLQLGVPGGPVHTVDPLSVDLSPLQPVLDGKRWIAHGAQRDLALMHQTIGARPGSLLDTQVLAGMVGFHFPARLDRLVEHFLGQHIEKGATLSNWNQRPLSPDQLEYAREDVRLLPRLADVLWSRLAHLDERVEGRAGQSWALQAGLELVEAAIAPPDPHATWRSLDLAPRLDGPTRAAMYALYRWREEEARRRNSPPHNILSPSIALDLARRRPDTLDGVRANRRIPGGFVKRNGNAILAVLAQARNAPPPPPVRDTERSGTRPLLEAWFHWTAQQLQVAPALLMPKKMLCAVVEHGADALSGWRSSALSENLRRLLAGDIALSIHENRLTAGTIDNRRPLYGKTDPT
jgi:ribonuclease D